MNILSKFRQLYDSGELALPFPGGGNTATRHRRLAEIARLDLPLARLAEAHADALAILHEAGRSPQLGLYGVWAAETTGAPLRFTDNLLTGCKMFCSGAGLLDRALITAGECILDVDLKAFAHTVSFDQSNWQTCAFAETQTATVIFNNTPVSQEDVVARDNWYLKRRGFWHGACGPASCWAGGATGLLDYALRQTRDDPHTMAHLGAMSASAWALRSYLDAAGAEIDRSPGDFSAAKACALTLRHLVDQAASDIVHRLGRAYGPRALAFNGSVSKRCQELELYLRQCHAERDLEALGREVFRAVDVAVGR